MVLKDLGDESIPPSPGGDAENCTPGAPAPADPAKCYHLTAHFPAGLKPLHAQLAAGGTSIPGASCAAPAGQTLSCAVSAYSGDSGIDRGGLHAQWLYATVRVGKEATGSLTSTFEASGAEAGSSSTVDPTLITKAPPAFGLDAFDALAAEGPAGAPLTIAGSHPYSLTNWLDFDTHTEAPTSLLGQDFPVAPLRDTFVDLPPGLIGNPAVGARCRSAQLAGNGYVVDTGHQITCPAASQLGRAIPKVSWNEGKPTALYPVPLFAMVPPRGVAARFGFVVLGTMILLDARLHQEPNGAWTTSVASTQTSEGLAVPGIETEFWGVPASAEHELERHCPGEDLRSNGGPSCHGAASQEAFFRLPTACTQVGKGLPWSAHLDSWWNQGAVEAGGYPDLSDPAWKSRSFETHQAPGYPLSPEPGLPASSFPSGYSGPTEWGASAGIEECANTPFDPSTHLQPTTPAADAPSGLSFEINMPQHGLTEPEAIAESDLKAVSVKLPEGFSSNASATEGLSSCSAAQIGLKTLVGQTPAVFSGGPQECPDSSKVGVVEIESPLVTEPEEPKVLHPLKGAVYLAAQHENPFGSLLALYLVIEDPQSGTILKLPGLVKADAKTGQVETIFENNPQLPFSRLRTEFFSGPRAVLKTPSTCGTYQAQVTLTPWSGNPPQVFDEPIEISSGPGGSCPAYGFEQKLSAGTANPLAGAFSPFNLELSREDGTQELAGLSATLPEGLVAKLAGIPYCPDSVLASISGEEGTGRAQEQSPSCPPASLVGRVIAGAGPGPDPAYVQSGRAYLAGPYKGAPLSLAVVVPVVVGPFDLGSVVVRNALQVNPETAQTTAVSDPLPTFLYGLPVQLRDLRVEVNRPNFTINPTSCEPMKVETQLTSAQGASASPSVRFQVAGCEALPFKPKLSLKLKGKANRGGHPALTATLVMPEGGANLQSAEVTLPKSEFIDQGHLNNVCTRAQFAEGGGGGERCPSGSIYGQATAISPILGYALSGNVYLRSDPARELPDLVLALHGPPSQPVAVEAVGLIDSVHGGIRTSFLNAPDVPVSKVTLKMGGGKKSLIENSTNICLGKDKASADLTAHNGLVADSKPVLKASGCGAKSHKRQAHRG